MSDRLFYPLAALVAVAMVALGLIWPQGYGARSPGPLGHPVVVPDYVIAEQRKAAEDVARAKAAEEAARAQAAAAAAAQTAPEAKR